MKFLPSQFAYLLSQRESRQNLKSLAQFIAVLVLIILGFAEAFHLIMVHVEHREHSWVTGLYWTLTVMTTLGFGDITFQTDFGRVFSIVVLLTGVFMLLIVLPFTFIRFFYAPWLEAQIRVRAPRRVPPDMTGHVVLCRYDDVARAFIQRLKLNAVPYVVVEPDVTAAAQLTADGVSVVTGDIDSVHTYEDAQVRQARMVVANLDDPTNTNVTLTVREANPDVPIVAFAEDRDAVDILELSGATQVIALKHRLGEYLASRVAAGAVRCQVIGHHGELRIAEFAVHDTRFSGLTIRDTRLRELTGLNLVGYWERGHMLPARPNAVLTDHSVGVVVGSDAQIAELDALLADVRHNDNPVVVIGGDKVGRAAIRALKARGTPVHVVERNPAMRAGLEALADGVFTGDADDRNLLERAGLGAAPSVLLTANDDAINIYVAIYCRKLNPDLRIVSRITHERNLEAIHRAGADFVLSFTSLGAKYLNAIMQGRELVLLGEGADVYLAKVPKSLAGRTLGESGIGAETGLSVIGLQREGQVEPGLGAKTVLSAGADLVMVGTSEQREAFARRFG